MSFGWSAGDVLSGVKLLINIVGSIQDANGSRTHFQELEFELHGLSRALIEITQLAEDTSPDQIPEMRSLKFVANSCDGTLKRFYEKIKPFDASLSAQSRRGKLNAAPKMVRWELLMRKENPELRTYLVAHVGYLNMRLNVVLMKSFSPKASTEVVSRQLSGQKLDILETIENIATKGAIPKLESLLLIADKVWKAQEEMMARLSETRERAPQPDIRHTWAQAPVILEDALGRLIPVPSEYDWEMLHAVIQAKFKEGPGQSKVRSGEYELFMNLSTSKPMAISTFTGLIPGSKVTMYVILGQYKGSERCPRIGCRSEKFEKHVEGGSVCLQCKTWFRKSSKSLPKPLKSPLGDILIGVQAGSPRAISKKSSWHSER